MKSRSRKFLWTVLIAATIAAISIPQYFYFEGLRGLPDMRDPITKPAIPRIVSQTFWSYLDGEGEPQISPKNPYAIIFNFFVVSTLTDSRPFHDADYMLLSKAARSLVRRDRKYNDWHLSNASASVWISRNWTVDETISTVLADSIFGNGQRGIDSAAKAYFGVPLTGIGEIETIYLLVITDAPKRYDPWCNPEYHRKRFDVFSERMGYSEKYDSIKIQAAPSGACD